MEKKQEPDYVKGIFLILLSVVLLFVAVAFGSCGIAMLKMAAG